MAGERRRRRKKKKTSSSWFCRVDTVLCTTPAAPTYYTHCQVWNNWRRETGGWGRDWRVLGVSRGRPSQSVSGIGSGGGNGSGRVLNLDRPSGKVSPIRRRQAATATELGKQPGFTSVWHPSYKGHVALLNSRRFCLAIDGGDLKGKEKKKVCVLGFPRESCLEFFFEFSLHADNDIPSRGLVPATLTRYGNFGARLPFRSGPRPTLAPAQHGSPPRVLSSCRCPRREKVAGNSGQLTVVLGWPNAMVK